eukprot:1161696-Pelagomonas_calceolata.AAC.15
MDERVPFRQRNALHCPLHAFCFAYRALHPTVGTAHPTIRRHGVKNPVVGLVQNAKPLPLGSGHTGLDQRAFLGSAPGSGHLRGGAVQGSE